MQNVVLTVHLILALLLTGVVLLQRNEGGSLLSGGGAMTARGAANALTRLTWILAIAFIVTSVGLTVLAARNGGGRSVIDSLVPDQTGTATGGTAPSAGAPAPAGDAVPPAPADAPVAPPAADAPATPPASN